MFSTIDNSTIPFAALKYLTSECNYGGRVTDDKDRRLITTLLGDYYNLKVIEDPLYKFAPDPNYRVPNNESHQDFIQFIKDLPIYSKPEVFGFHSNADITKDINETTLFLDSLLLCSSEGGSSEGSSQDEMLKKLIESIMNDFPQEFDIDEAMHKYPVNYNESMNTVLTQELNRFNKLIAIIRSSLKDINLALQGKILLSQNLERACKQIIDGKIPQLWIDRSYPSLKPLGAYVIDLKERLKFFQDWIDKGAAVNFWLSGFYFTQSFLTGVLQNFARKYTIPIDEIDFDFLVRSKQEEIKPEDGAYVYGLFIEGAKWNPITMELDESDPKCPVLLLKPSHTKKLSNFPHYNSPVYKTSARRGTLSTTGHSTNFVMWIRLPSARSETHWVKRGVALLTQLDD